MIHSSDIWDSEVGKMAIARVVDRANQYWMANVYKYYHRNTGTLGNASMVSFRDGVFVVSMKPLIDLETGREYGKAIRHGVSPGVGRYDPKVGKRRSTGYFPGVAKSKFWDPWMREFRPGFKQIVREELAIATRGYVKQQLKGRGKV